MVEVSYKRTNQSKGTAHESHENVNKSKNTSKEFKKEEKISIIVETREPLALSVWPCIKNSSL